MADQTSNGNHCAGQQQTLISAAIAIGSNSLRQIMQFQASMLKLWANNVERFAQNYEKALEKTASPTVEERWERETRRLEETRPVRRVRPLR